MNRTDVINGMADKFGYSRYLEIGVSTGRNFRAVKCQHKIGVDPNRRCSFRMTSDDFFSVHFMHFDLVFIDGLHIEDQVDRDIFNSFSWLAPNGSVVLHDCNPPSEWHQRPLPQQDRKPWNGTVWRSWVKLRANPALEMFVVDTVALGVSFSSVRMTEIFSITS
jgi:hypothetical protein